MGVHTACSTHTQNGRTYGIFLSANAQTRLSIPAVLPEPSLHSHMLNLGVHTAYFISLNAQTCLSVCAVLPEPSLNCSRTCTKWAYIWHIFSVNAQTRLIMHAVSEPSLLSHMHKMGVFMASFISQCSNKP